MSVPQVEGAIGKGTLDRIAQKLGVSGSIVGSALAYPIEAKLAEAEKP
jgi:uncharacterized protein YidB (DUF937 family)